MDIREEIRNTIRQNNPLAGSLVIIPGRVFEKLLLPNKSQEDTPTDEGYDIPWTLENSTIEYILENNGDIIDVDDLTPPEIIITRKYLVDKNNPTTHHIIHEIRDAEARGHRYLKTDEPTYDEYLLKRLKDHNTTMETLLKQNKYGNFTETITEEYRQLINQDPKTQNPAAQEPKTQNPAAQEPTNHTGTSTDKGE